MAVLIQAPKSKFFRVICRKCKSEQIIFSKASTEVKCLICKESLANPTGGNAHVKGKIVGILG